MSYPVPAYVSRIRNNLRTAEAACDASLLANLELMRSIVGARQTERAPTPYVGQQALVRLGRAIQEQIATANDIFRAHEELHRVAKQELMVGGEEDKPANFVVDEAEVTARAA